MKKVEIYDESKAFQNKMNNFIEILLKGKNKKISTADIMNVFLLMKISELEMRLDQFEKKGIYISEN